MPLSSQCYIYSVGTDAFYDEKEHYIHDRMSKLYRIVSDKGKKKKNIAPVWKKKAAKRLIKKHKEKITALLDEKQDAEIVRELNQEYIRDGDIISLFESALTRACGIKAGEFSKDLVQVEFYFYQVMKNLIYYGFDYEGQHYVYFSSSAGAIRKHRGLFIREELYKLIQPKLTCGLTIDHVNELGGCVINKWLAYVALSSSATEVWEDFDIDKAIVCDDFEIEVFGDMDYIDAKDYSITRKYTSVGIPMNDGVGMMLDGPSRVIRGPFIKGAMIQFPFDKFLREKCLEENWVVSDIYGKEYNIIEQDIRYILTKSQFKMAKYFPDWQTYKDFFKKYQCEMGWCNIEQPYVPKARINYQMLNSLHDMTDEEIECLVKESNQELEEIGADFQTTMRLLGATEYNKNPSYMQEALMIYPELFRDKYNRDLLLQTQKSLVKQARAGRLRVNGYYRLASPDLYAYCERLFLGITEPKGLLKNGEVAISQFKDGEELDCLRSPHLYFEHCVRTNNQSEEIQKWFTTKCVYTSCNDLISRILALDWDGDILLVTNDKTVLKVAKRNQENFVPLLFDMKKANPVEITSENIYNGLIAAFKYGKIGNYSNSCSKIWGKENINQDSFDALKLLVAESNWSIDAAKCLYMPIRPQAANNLITSQTKGKLPHYFVWAKDKVGLPAGENSPPSQVEPPNNSTMNRIAAAIPDAKVHYSKTIGKFDYRVLMNLSYDFSLAEDSPVVKSYNYWNARQNAFNESDDNVKDQDLYKYRTIKRKILEESGEEINYVVNTLVAYLYTVRKSSAKKTLWACFGDVILENIRANVQSLGKICPVCGKRFQPNPKAPHTICCSSECSRVYDNQKRSLRRSDNVPKSLEPQGVEDISDLKNDTPIGREDKNAEKKD